MRQHRRRNRRMAASGAVALALLAAAAARGQTAGEELYLEHCAVCHQPNGKGIPGFIPPLAGDPLVTADDPQRVQVFLSRVIFGFHGGLIVNNEVYSGRMPPLGYRGRINDSELLELINYQRGAWGNDARPVTFAELAKAREAGRR